MAPSRDTTDGIKAELADKTLLFHNGGHLLALTAGNPMGCATTMHACMPSLTARMHACR